MRALSGFIVWSYAHENNSWNAVPAYPLRMQTDSTSCVTILWHSLRGRSLPEALTTLDATISVTLQQLNNTIDFFQLPQDLVAKLREVRTTPFKDPPPNTTLPKLMYEKEVHDVAAAIAREAHKCWHAGLIARAQKHHHSLRVLARWPSRLMPAPHSAMTWASC